MISFCDLYELCMASRTDHLILKINHAQDACIEQYFCVFFSTQTFKPLSFHLEFCRIKFSTLNQVINSVISGSSLKSTKSKKSYTVHLWVHFSITRCQDIINWLACWSRSTRNPNARVWVSPLKIHHKIILFVLKTQFLMFDFHFVITIFLYTGFAI